MPLEGDYSHWTLYDSFDDDTLEYWMFRFALVNKDETAIMLFSGSAGNYGFRKYTIADKTLGPLQGSYSLNFAGWYSAEGTMFSVLNTYVVAITTEEVDGELVYHVVVFKNGDLICTIPASEFTVIRTVSISKSGKYIIVSGTRTTGNEGWSIYVGS